MKMLSFLSLGVLLLSCASANAGESKAIGDRMFNIYELHTTVKKLEDVPIPSISVYNLKTQSFLTSESAFSVLVGKEKLGPIHDSIKKLFIEPQNRKVDQSELFVILTQKNIQSDYIVFYYNVGQELLAMFPSEQISHQVESKVSFLIKKNEKVDAYTLW